MYRGVSLKLSTRTQQDTFKPNYILYFTRETKIPRQSRPSGREGVLRSLSISIYSGPLAGMAWCYLVERATVKVWFSF